MLFDTHAHYDDAAFDADRHEVLASLPDAGVSGVVNCACSRTSAEASLALAETYDFVYAAVGVHPENIEDATGGYLKDLAVLAAHSRCVAIGEIGLDYHWRKDTAERQKAVFAEQIRLANALHLPVIIHEREAFADCYDILKHERPQRGVMHCFSGNTQTLRLVLELGLFIGVGGMLTFKNNVKTVEMCPFIPDDRLLLETDCPYLSPVPMRGRRNRSDYLGHVADRLAELRHTTREAIEVLTEQNARAFFNI